MVRPQLSALSDHEAPDAPPELKSVTGHRYRGVSVEHIATALVAEVEAAGLTRDATIYEIVPLVILPRGAGVQCPRDGLFGCAYVDAIHGPENAGIANLMLSYTWGTSIGDIADGLLKHCRSRDLDPKRSYAWMCCLCVNQHRVRAAAERGQVVPFEEFREEFADHVERIGNVVALMTPWRAPTYVTRVWTNFEIFTAISLGPEICNVFITMPTSEAADLRQALLEGSSFDEMWRVLSTLRIEEANASVEEDKSRIFHMIEQGPGFHSLNSTVSSYLQTSFVRCCEGFLEERLTDMAVADSEVAMLYSRVGRLYLRVRRSDMLERADDSFQRSRVIRERRGSLQTMEGVMLLHDIGTANALLGRLSDALEVYKEARGILRRLGQLGTLESAKLLSSVGMTRRAIGDLEGALKYYQEAKRIHELTGTLETPDGAGLLAGIGVALSQRGDVRGALDTLQLARDIRVITGTLATPDGAGMLSCLGNVMRLSKDTEGALRVMKQAQELYEQLGLLETPGGALLLRYVGVMRMEIGELDAALQLFTHAEGILKSTQTMHSPIAAKLLCDLSLLHLCLGDVAEGFNAYAEAHRLHMQLNLQDSELAQRIWEVGRKPEIVGCALARWRQCRRVWQPTEVQTPQPSRCNSFAVDDSLPLLAVHSGEGEEACKRLRRLSRFQSFAAMLRATEWSSPNASFDLVSGELSQSPQHP